MKAIILSIDTSGLNELRRIQSNVIRRSYNMAIDGQSFQSINKQIPQELDGHLHRCGVQRGIDLSNTKKTMIFGGRKQFIRRCKGLISNEEWKEYRTQPLYSIGQANVKGNRKFRIDFETRKLIYKDSETYYEFDIPKLKSNWEVILEELSYKSNNKEIALTYQVGKDSVSIIYDEQKLRCYQNKYIKYKKKDGRYIGIDLNPDRIGIAIYNTSHKGSEVIHAEQYDLTSDDQNKRRNEISHIADTIYKLMAHYNVSRCGMEDLTIKSKDHNKGRRFNKKINFWIRTFILNKLSYFFPNADLRIEKSPSGYPIILQDDKKDLFIPVSFAHHDRFIAYSFLLS